MNGNSVIVDITTSPANPGDIFFVSDGSATGSYCVILESVTLGRAVYNEVDGPYTDCLDCLTANTINVLFANCNQLTKIVISLSELNFVPNNPSFYNISYDSGFGQESGCFTKPGQTIDSPSVTYLSSVEYSSCELCSFSANNTTFLVEDCILGNIYYVFAPITTLIGSVISFIPNNSLDQLCGTIIEQSSEVFDSIYLATFDGCDNCLDQVTSKRELISCIDGTVEIVYTSALYNVGESSYLTIKDPNEGFSGCYRIGDESTDAVTVTGYLSYGPSPSCEECISCQGFEFEYMLCADNNITGSTFSDQYIEIGQSFFHPLSGCCEVTQYITGGTSVEDFSSFYEFGDCTPCTASTSNNEFEVWVGETCFRPDPIIVVVPSGFTTGDTFTMNSGILTNDCVKLTELYTNQEISNYCKTTEVKYTDCQPCLSNTFIGLPLVKCGDNTSNYYSISLTNLFDIYENSGIFSDGSYNCYFAIEGCALPNYPIFTPFEFFGSCFECNQPLSAGTESTICVICCPCTTGQTVTAVSPPHPSWTNAQGKTVILLDAIALGGMNGLNN